MANDNVQRVKLRLRPPGFRWHPVHFIPFFTDLAASVGLVFLPVLVGQTIDLYSAGQADQARLRMLWLAVILLYFVVHEKVTWGITFGVIVRLERDWRVYAGQLAERANSRDTGSLIAILNKDARTIGYMWHPLILAWSGVGVAVFGSWQLWLISPLVATVAVVGLLLTVVSLTLISRILERHADTFRDRVGESTSRASDIASSIRTIVGLGAQRVMMGRYATTAQNVYCAQLRLESVQTWSFAARNFLVGTVTMLAVAFALRGQVEQGSWITDIPAGQLVATVGLVNTLTGPMWSVEMFLFSWRNARVALKRMSRLEQEALAGLEETAVEPLEQNKIPRPVAGVNYINPRDYNMTAYEYAQGLDAALRLAEAAPEQSSGVLLSESNPMIFASTLGEHMQLGTAGLSDEYIIELLRITDSLEIAHRLGGKSPESFLKAVISSEGANLSGGQRQRLALARALAQQAHTLVLTEPLNSVDEPSQKFILDNLEKLVGCPGSLRHIQTVYIISTTAEVEQRLRRKGARG